MKTERLCVVIDKEIRRKLRLVAAQKDKNMSDVVRWILTEFFTELEKE